MSESKLLTSEDLARELGVSLPSLARWRGEGAGPAYVLVGRQVRYERAAVDAWIAERRMLDTKTSVMSSAKPATIGS